MPAPGHFAARIQSARRSTATVRLPEAAALRVADSIAQKHHLRSAPVYRGGKAMRPGFGSRTLGLSQHVFEGDQGRFAVVAKEIRGTPDGLPREIALSRIIFGERRARFGFPDYLHDFARDDGTLVLCMGEVRAAPGWPLVRARALGALAATPLEGCYLELAQCLGSGSDQLEDLLTPRTARRVRRAFGKDSRLELAALAGSCREKLLRAQQRLSGGPFGLAHGDAKRSNLMVDHSGRVIMIDVGQMLLAVPGHDIAGLSSSRWILAGSVPHALPLIEAAYLKAFSAGYREAGGHIDTALLRLGCAIGYAIVAKRHCRWVRRLAPGRHQPGTDTGPELQAASRHLSYARHYFNRAERLATF